MSKYSRTILSPSENVTVCLLAIIRRNSGKCSLCWLRGRTYSRRSKGITVVQSWHWCTVAVFSLQFSKDGLLLCGSIKMLLITFTCTFFWSKFEICVWKWQLKHCLNNLNRQQRLCSSAMNDAVQYCTEKCS